MKNYDTIKYYTESLHELLKSDFNLSDIKTKKVGNFFRFFFDVNINQEDQKSQYQHVKTQIRVLNQLNKIDESKNIDINCTYIKDKKIRVEVDHKVKRGDK